MPFSHGVVVCHINFRGAAKRTFYAVLSVRKRCSSLHGKDMRQSVPVFASQMVEIREILWVWKRKVIRQTTDRAGLGGGRGGECHRLHAARRRARSADREPASLCSPHRRGGYR